MQSWPAVTFCTFVILFNPVAGRGATDLAWLSGEWCATTGNTLIEEVWLLPRGGLMLGVNRTTRGERNAAFEFLRIESGEGQPVRYVAQPNGAPPTSFDLVDSGVDWVRFENPEHDFPQRIEYRRKDDRLSAVVAGPGEGGVEVQVPFEFTRCRSIH